MRLIREKAKEPVDVPEDVVQTWPKHVETLEARWRPGSEFP